MPACSLSKLRVYVSCLAENMIWKYLDLNRNFKLDSDPVEWRFALTALGFTDANMMGFMNFLDTDRDDAISLQVSTASRQIHFKIPLYCVFTLRFAYHAYS